MCQKAADFVISGKLSQDGSVSQHTPGKKVSAKTYIILGLKLGEGNGKPLQYSCLENPMDGGAW